MIKAVGLLILALLLGLALNYTNQNHTQIPNLFGAKPGVNVSVGGK